MGNQVELLFGVKGGGSVAGQSGRDILEDLKSIVTQIESSETTKLKFGVDSAKTKTELNSINQQIQKIVNDTKGKKSKIKLLAYADEQKQLAELNVELKKKTALEKEAETASKRAAKERSKALSDETKISRADSKTQKLIRTLEDRYAKYQSKIDKAGFGGETQSLISNLKSGNYGADTAKAEQNVDRLINRWRDAGVEALSLKEKIKNLFDQHLSTAVAMVGVHLLQLGLSQLYQNVVQLDNAVVDLQIATGGSREETKKLVSDYSDMAQELGATTVQVTEAADSWLNKIGRLYRNI